MGMAEQESWRGGVSDASGDERATGRGGRAGHEKSWPYSDLIVRFGRMVVTAAFWMVISVPSAISTPTYASVTFVTLPTIPPFVTTSSPFAIAASMLRCSFWRFICGRIMMKYSTANMRIKGRKLMMLDCAPSAPLEKNDTLVSPL